LDAIWSVVTTDPGRQARSDVKHFQEVNSLLAPYFEGHFTGKRVLDVGCGHRYAQAALFASSGNTAVGIDLEYVMPKKNPWELLRSLRQNGMIVTARTIAHLSLGKYKQYYKTLEHVSGIKLSHTNLQIKRMDVTRMDFPDETFDAAVSIAVFEHIPDVPVAVRELGRVLKAGGVACLYIDCFPALSGGHHPEWAQPQIQKKRRVPPWDHLRGNKSPVPFYLNRWRGSDYVRAFRESLEVLEVSDVEPEEGRSYLTPEIRRELAEYSEEELIRRAIRIIVRRPRGPVTPENFMSPTQSIAETHVASKRS
jgi:SAM-dependent methyltransferase